MFQSSCARLKLSQNIRGACSECKNRAGQPLRFDFEPRCTVRGTQPDTQDFEHRKKNCPKSRPQMKKQKEKRQETVFLEMKDLKNAENAVKTAETKIQATEKLSRKKRTFCEKVQF